MNEQKAENAIKTAWMFGIFSGVLTLIITILCMVGIVNWDFDISSLADVALIWGLTFGVYKKSRVCAIVLFIYFMISKIIMMIDHPGGVGSMVIFGMIYFQGIRGTIYYHKNINIKKSEETVA